MADDELRDEAGKEGWPDPVAPDFALLVQRLGGQELLDGRAAAEDPRNPAEDADSVFRAARIVQSALVLGEDVSRAVDVCSIEKVHSDTLTREWSADPRGIAHSHPPNRPEW